MSPADFGEFVENLGYDSLWTSEGWGNNAFVYLSNIAAVTENIRLGTSVINVFSRSPALVASSGVSLNRISDNRAIVGVGAGHPNLIEDLHGTEFHRPIRRTHETVELVKAFVNGTSDTIEYDGEIFQVSGFEPLDIPVSVHNAALGEANRRVTGRLCDGWIPYNIPIPELEKAFSTVATAAREVGRQPDDIAVTPWVSAAVHQNPDVARREVRYNIAEYIGRHTDDTYKNAIAGRFPEKAEQIATAWRSGNHTRAIKQVSPEMIESLAIAGSPSEARKQMRELTNHPIVDVPIISVPYRTNDETTETTIQELAPAVL